MGFAGALFHRVMDTVVSFFSLPLWVFVWIFGVLLPTNAAALVVAPVTGEWSMWLAAAGALLVLLVNSGVALYERGASKLLAPAHLVAWGPPTIIILVLLLSGRWSWTEDAREGTKHARANVALVFGVIYVVINTISLIFDVLDTVRWVRGERDIAGADKIAARMKRRGE